MTYRLAALDLDDTLLNRDGQISAQSLVSIEMARGMGCEVTLVTARSWRATQRFVEPLQLTLPFICVTGAATFSPGGELLRQVTMPLEDARILAARAEEERWSMRLYFGDGQIHTSRLAEDFTTRTGAAYPAEALVGDLRPFLSGDEEPLQVVCIGHRSVEGALDCISGLPDLVATTYERGTEYSRTHIMHRSVSKGSALAALCQRLGIPREAVIAMGDGEPDRSMIEWAGVGVAMGWAAEHVRRAADLVMSADEEHPVARALDQLLLRRQVK